MKNQKFYWESHEKLSLSQFSFIEIDRMTEIKGSEFLSKPEAFSFAIGKPWGIHSKDLEWSARTAAKTSLFSLHLLIFSNISKRQCCALNPCLKPHWNFDQSDSKCSLIFIDIHTMKATRRMMHFVKIRVISERLKIRKYFPSTIQDLSSPGCQSVQFENESGWVLYLSINLFLLKINQIC